MNKPLTEEELSEISDRLAEYAAGYCGFLDWARGDIVEEEPLPGPDEPWRAAFLVFAGKGRVEVYRQILQAHEFPIDSYTLQLIDETSRELDAWLSESWNRVARLFEEAFPVLLDAYRNSYLKKTPAGLGWDFDDFIDERDLLEFFLIGVGDTVPTKNFAARLAQFDRQIQEQVEQLGLEEYEAEFFPGRIPWFPERFWWHHSPSERPA